MEFGGFKLRMWDALGSLKDSTPAPWRARLFRMLRAEASNASAALD